MIGQEERKIKEDEAVNLITKHQPNILCVGVHTPKNNGHKW
jgi:uncharacterized Zn-finger protein